MPMCIAINKSFFNNIYVYFLSIRVIFFIAVIMGFKEIKQKPSNWLKKIPQVFPEG